MQKVTIDAWCMDEEWNSKSASERWDILCCKKKNLTKNYVRVSKRRDKEHYNKNYRCSGKKKLHQNFFNILRTQKTSSSKMKMAGRLKESADLGME